MTLWRCRAEIRKSGRRQPQPPNRPHPIRTGVFSGYVGVPIAHRVPTEQSSLGSLVGVESGAPEFGTIHKKDRAREGGLLHPSGRVGSPQRAVEDEPLFSANLLRTGRNSLSHKDMYVIARKSRSLSKKQNQRVLVLVCTPITKPRLQTYRYREYAPTASN